MARGRHRRYGSRTHGVQKLKWDLSLHVSLLAALSALGRPHSPLIYASPKSFCSVVQAGIGSRTKGYGIRIVCRRSMRSGVKGSVLLKG